MVVLRRCIYVSFARKASYCFGVKTFYSIIRQSSIDSEADIMHYLRKRMHFGDFVFEQLID